MNQPAKNTPAIVPPAHPIELPDRAVAVIKSLERYMALQKALDEAMPDCWIMLDGKRFRKKAYWSAVALALGVEVELVSEERVQDLGANSDGKPIVGLAVMYKATLGTRLAFGDGACTTDEPRLYGTYHNVRARAHTRGRNRAISHLVAFGEVSAEEADLGGDESWPRQ